MPRIVLTSNAVAYHLGTLCRAQRALFPFSPREMSVQLPSAAVEAANAGATLKIGGCDSVVTPTDVTAPDLVLEESDSTLYRMESGVPANDKYLKASVNNAVVYVSGA